MDENPMQVKFDVNGRYPDTIPMSTMPPDILAALPPLGRTSNTASSEIGWCCWILQSHLILDFVADTFDL
jgi:hypothetical protein